MRRLVPSILASASLVLMTALCGCEPSSPGDQAAAPLLRIASDATFAPFHYMESGEPTGFDIELARRVAQNAGYRPEIVVLDYDDLFTDLASGAVDLVAASTGITKERKQRFLFSEPYFTTCQAILVRRGEGEPRALLELAGRRVGAAGAGTSLAALEKLAERIELEPTKLGKGQAGVAALTGGDIDALIVDEFDALAAAAHRERDLRVLRQPAALEDYGLVMRHDADELKTRIDESLKQLTSRGVLDQLSERFELTRDQDWPIELPPR